MIPLPHATPAGHGGPDAHGVPRHDFSSNQNALGPCPAALAAVQTAPAQHYPDPSYLSLRTELAQFYSVTPAQILIGASASELIFRLSLWQRLHHPQASVYVPPQHYGDYRLAAEQLGLALTPNPTQASLIWLCQPSSPAGQTDPTWPTATPRPKQTWVLDCAYQALQLQPQPTPRHPALWQLISPNKALGLTGVRGAFCIIPEAQLASAPQLHALSPSWPLGAHGLAMLHAWTQPAVQDWLARSLHTLADWKQRQLQLCTELGWQHQTSLANYFLIRPPQAADQARIAALRQHGIKLRDASSFGLPGWWRMAVLPPAAQSALRSAWAKV